MPPRPHSSACKQGHNGLRGGLYHREVRPRNRACLENPIREAPLIAEDFDVIAQVDLVQVLEDVTGVEAADVAHDDRVAALARASRGLGLAGLEGWHNPGPLTILVNEWSGDDLGVQTNAGNHHAGDGQTRFRCRRRGDESRNGPRRPGGYRCRKPDRQ
jgi:hypothetical protein